ncbi:MAG: metallophosphoesterase family protein, partial [Flavobacteriales bacterium]|nr:metallophosphoesterase family protein [Flavobacteriales bacterium]
MTRIGLLSDTHGFLDPQLLDAFSSCDEIWHAGDIGDLSVCQQLAEVKPLRAVYGNIDGNDIRAAYPKDLHFSCGGLSVWITHIGGHPQRYAPGIRKKLLQDKPDLFVCGHSHILRVMRDPKLP